VWAEVLENEAVFVKDTNRRSDMKALGIRVMIVGQSGGDEIYIDELPMKNAQNARCV
jgi:hypothetical protein